MAEKRLNADYNSVSQLKQNIETGCAMNKWQFNISYTVQYKNLDIQGHGERERGSTLEDEERLITFLNKTHTTETRASQFERQRTVHCVSFQVDVVQ